MLVMSVVKEHYNSITVEARRLIKKKCIHVCLFEALKKKIKTSAVWKGMPFFFMNDVVQMN